MVDEAELLEVNPNYAHVRILDGRKTTVSIRDISPRSEEKCLYEAAVKKQQQPSSED